MTKIFSQRLLELREKRNLNQRDLAKGIGMTQAAISRWEKNIQIPDIESLIKLCRFFDVSADYLLGFID